VSEAGPALHIEIELGGPLGALLQGFELRRIADGVAADTGRLIEDLGLSSAPHVEVVTSDSWRVLGMVIGDRPVPTSPSSIEEVWATVVPPKLAGLTLDGIVDRRPPIGRDQQSELAARFAQRLAVEVIGQAAGCLIGDRQVKSYLAAGWSDEWDRSAVPATAVSQVLGQLLDWGVSVRQPDRVLRDVRRSLLAGRRVDDTAEAVFRSLHRDGIEVRGHPMYLAELLGLESIEGPLTGQDPRLPDGARQELRQVLSDLGQEIGIDLPEVTWTPSPDLPHGILGIGINDLVVVRRGLAPDELLVDDTVDRVQRFGVEAHHRPHPRLRSECAIANVSALATVQEMGVRWWRPLGFAYLLLRSAVEARVDRVVGVWTVEDWLAELDLQGQYPDLVRTAIARFSIYDLTRVLRGLAREGVCLADRPMVLDRLLLFDSVPADAGAGSLLDDVLPVRDTGRRDSGDWRELLAFARLSMPGQVTRASAQGRHLVIAHRIPADRMERLSTRLDAAGRDELLRPIGALAERMRRNRSEATVLTSLAARPAVRALVEQELPQVHVVAEPELLPDVELVTLNEEDADVSVRLPLLRERVGSMLDAVGPGVEIEDGVWSFVYESVQVRVSVAPWGDDASIISMWCVTNRAMPPSDALFKWVALHADDWVFGHLGASELDDGVALGFRHTLLGDFLDTAEFWQALSAIANTAPKISEEVRERFQGEVRDDQATAGKPPAGDTRGQRARRAKTGPRRAPLR
jgi:hypothetical protein